MKRILFLTFLVFIFSCSDKKQLKQDLALLQSREIRIPLDKMLYQANRRDTLMTDFTDSELKLVIYFDPSTCSSCAIKAMHNWYRIIDDTEKYQGRLKFYFLFSPGKEEVRTVKIALRGNMFDYPVFIDSEGMFAKENPHLPKNPQFHSFLLDQNNKVVLIGNPLNNPKIEEMFYKIVEERLGKK